MYVCFTVEPQESDMSETQVILGVWNEDAHKAWYLKEGHKKKSKT